MTFFRFSTSRVIGAAVALTLGSVTSAVAQQPTRTDSSRTMRDSTMRRDSMSTGARVRKDGTTNTMSTPSSRVTKETTPAPMQPEPTPTPAPTPAPVDSSMMTRSTTVDTSVSSTTTTTTTTSVVTNELPPMGRRTRFGNGFYVGVHGGTNFPQSEINDVYDAGYNVGGQIGWDPTNSPLGVRLNATWNRLNGRNLTNETINNVTYTGELRSVDLYSAFADAKLRLPFGRFLGATSGLYAVGGAGLTYLRNFDRFQAQTGTNVGQSRTDAFNPEDATRFAANLGGGVSWGIGAASLFVESRYVRVFTQNRNTDYVPLTIGLTFH